YKCSECGRLNSGTRALNRHLWAIHPEYAQQAGIPSTVEVCPVPSCGYRGRKDNVVRHQRLKHTQ
ncbi:hypothetical protein QBC35DRAFT_387655, partial [Podospora australis]